MMKISDIALFYGIIIWTVNDFADALLHDEARIFITANNETNIVHLKKTETFLANSNLPMWIVRNGKLNELDHESVMEQVGPFTTYQDRESSSAAVYFHKRREFDGTIDARFVINGLSISSNDDDDNDNNKDDNEIGEAAAIDASNPGPIFTRSTWGHAEKTGVIEPKPGTPDYITEWTETETQTEKAMVPEPCQLRQQIFYIETLVVVDYKMGTQFLGQHSEAIPILVSYILSLFNTVDMLFSKMDSPKIRMNIAGIVIENDRKSIPKMEKCYKKAILFEKKIEAIDAFCAEENIRSFFSDQGQTIPLDSHDVIVYLTRYSLYENVYNKNSRKNEINYLAGLTAALPSGIYSYKKSDGKLKPSAMITDSGAFRSFPVIAHELVHSFGILDHDEQLDLINGVCCEKIMKPRNGFCQNCLDWSESTKTQLINIFKSPDGCIFKNEPHSLHPPGPRQILTADEQCQCYGYKSAEDVQNPRKTQKMCWNAIPGRIFGYCNAYLQCVDEDNKVHSAPVPMDGTPCDEHRESNKVCWNRTCKGIGERESAWDMLNYILGD